MFPVSLPRGLSACGLLAFLVLALFGLGSGNGCYAQADGYPAALYSAEHLLQTKAPSAAQSSECASVRSAAQRAYSKAIRDSVEALPFNDPSPSGASFGDDHQRGGERASALQPVDLPVQWHIVRSAAGLGGLLDHEAGLLLDTLNHFFRPAGIRFYACGPANTILSDQHYRLNSSHESTLCDANDRSGVINIYIVDELLLGGMPICGYAYFPGGLDRVILDADCARNGNTIVHEMGHYLGLDHTHGPQSGSLELVDGSNCSGAGDRICDTPADPGLNYFNVSAGCVYGGTAADAMGMAYRPATDNFMSYARLSCRSRFSPQQLEAMAYSATYERSHLQCACAPPSGLLALVRGNSAQLQWHASEAHDAFRLTGEALEGPLAGQKGQRITRTPSMSMPPLRTYTHYVWTVQARCGEGAYSLVSWPDTFRTEGPASSQRAVQEADLEGGLQNSTEAMGLLDWGPVPLAERLWMRWQRPEDVWLSIQLIGPRGESLSQGKLFLPAGLQRMSWPIPDGLVGTVVLLLEVEGDRLRIPLVASP